MIGKPGGNREMDEVGSAKKHEASGQRTLSYRIHHVVILGAGWTGRQIAGQMVAHGISVSLIDNQQQSLDASKEWILNQRAKFIAEGYWPRVEETEFCSRLSFQLAPEDPRQLAHDKRGSVDLVLETVPEQIALKRRILKRWAAAFPPPTVIASNSSYFVPSMFSGHVTAPERFAHFHFHVPIWKATIVDIASAPETDDLTRSRLIDLAQQIGQTPIVNRAENSGYVFNWMLKSLLQSALQLLDRGVATPEEIELAWCRGTGMAAGPFGIMDQIGLDIIQQTMSHARFVEGDASWGPLLQRIDALVHRGHLGVKSGRGFFEYPDGQPPGG